MLSMQNGSSFVPCPPPQLDLGPGWERCASTATLPRPAVPESPSSPDDSPSHGAAAAADGIPHDLPGPWPRESQAPSVPPVELESRVDGPPSEPAPSAPNPSPPTVNFAVVSSSDADMSAPDVTRKVEEIDDSMDGLERSREAPAAGTHAEPPSSAAGAPVSVPRKRGRPRKHPLPTPGTQAKVAKGRSKTGCITCRRRKKKCDETKPSCLNCQKNAVVCEGYPPKEIWKSGRQKLEDGRALPPPPAPVVNAPRVADLLAQRPGEAP